MSIFSRIFRREDGSAEPGLAGEAPQADPIGESSPATSASPAGAPSASDPARASLDTATGKASSAEARQHDAPASAREDKGVAPPALPGDKARSDAAQAVEAARAQVARAATVAANPEKKAGSLPKPLPSAPALGGKGAAPRAANPLPAGGHNAENALTAKRTSTVHEPARASVVGGTKAEPASAAGAGAQAARAKPAAALGSSVKTIPLATGVRTGPAEKTPASTATPGVSSARPATATAAPSGSDVPAVSAPVAPPAPEPRALSREQFRDPARESVQPLVDCLVELASGSVPVEWLTGCLTSLRALVPLSLSAADPAIKESLAALIATIERESTKTELDGAAQSELERAYGLFAARAGLVVNLESERARRSSVLVDALLLQTEGVQPIMLERIHAAGFTGMERLRESTSDEFARAAGVDHDLAERVLTSVRSFSQDFPAPGDPTRMHEKRRLAVLLKELHTLELRFQQASAGWSNDDLSARRVLRSERAQTLHRIEAVFARLGELDRIARLERLPYAAKVNDVADYLREGLPAKAAAS